MLSSTVVVGARPRAKPPLLSELRRFMPAGPVDAGLRKTFGIG